MSLHDEYARMTPFEIAFPDAGVLDDLRAAVTEEASSRRVDPELPGIFLTLGSVDDFVRGLKEGEAPGEALHQYGPVVFHALHFVNAGRPLYLVNTDAARRLVESSPASDPQPPQPAGYLQLPQHLFWMDVPDGVPESIDGVFWFLSHREVLHVLPITGVLPDRPGFRALALPEAPWADAPQWLRADMRDGEDDYSSAIPGHDLDGLYSVTTAGEILKLLARFFAYLGAAPTVDLGAPTPVVPERAKGPRPSALPFTRVGPVASA